MRPNATAQAMQRRQNISRTNDWADGILKDLDGLLISEQRYSNSLRRDTPSPDGAPMSPGYKRSTVINVVLRKTAPTATSNEPIAPQMTKVHGNDNDGRTVSTATITALATTPTTPATAAATSTTSTTPSDNHRILKPEKHVSSFTLSSDYSENPYHLLTSRFAIVRRTDRAVCFVQMRITSCAYGVLLLV